MLLSEAQTARNRSIRAIEFAESIVRSMPRSDEDELKEYIAEKLLEFSNREARIIHG